MSKVLHGEVFSLGMFVVNRTGSADLRDMRLSRLGAHPVLFRHRARNTLPCKNLVDHHQLQLTTEWIQRNTR